MTAVCVCVCVITMYIFQEPIRVVEAEVVGPAGCSTRRTGQDVFVHGR